MLRLGSVEGAANLCAYESNLLLLRLRPRLRLRVRLLVRLQVRLRVRLLVRLRVRLRVRLSRCCVCGCGCVHGCDLGCGCGPGNPLSVRADGEIPFPPLPNVPGIPANVAEPFPSDPLSVGIHGCTSTVHRRCSENSCGPAPGWNVESADATAVGCCCGHGHGLFLASLAFTAILVASTVCVHGSADTTQDVLSAFTKWSAFPFGKFAHWLLCVKLAEVCSLADVVHLPHNSQNVTHIACGNNVLGLVIE
jgi:hypothetical protein